MKTTLSTVLGVLLLLRSHEIAEDPASRPDPDLRVPRSVFPSPEVPIGLREGAGAALVFPSRTGRTEARFPDADPSPDVSPTGNDDSTYEADGFRLCGLLEGWPGKSLAETKRLLAEAFVESLRSRFPGITQEQLSRLSDEFEPWLSVSSSWFGRLICIRRSWSGCWESCSWHHPRPSW